MIRFYAKALSRLAGHISAVHIVDFSVKQPRALSILSPIIDSPYRLIQRVVFLMAFRCSGGGADVHTLLFEQMAIVLGQRVFLVSYEDHQTASRDAREELRISCGSSNSIIRFFELPRSHVFIGFFATDDDRDM